MISLYHKVNIAILGLTPVCLAMGGGPLQLPFDLLLGLALPIHGHVGMNLVGTDYVKKFVGKGAIMPFRMGMAGATGLTMVGLLKLNLAGQDITQTIVDFWRPKA